MDTLAIVILLISIWLVADAVIGIWRTRNPFFAWQFIGIGLARLPLEALLHPQTQGAPMWSLLLGLLGTFGLIIGLTAAIVSLLTGTNAIADYIKAKQERSIIAWLLCLYQQVKQETPVHNHRPR
jgi:hypothetical protein